MTQKTRAVFEQQPGKSRYEIAAMVERKNGEQCSYYMKNGRHRRRMKETELYITEVTWVVPNKSNHTKLFF